MDINYVLQLLDGILPPPVFYEAEQLAISKPVAEISPFVGVVLASVLNFRVSVKIVSLLLAALLYGVYWGILRDLSGELMFWIQQVERALCLALFGYALAALIGEGARKAVHALQKPSAG